MEFNFSKDEEMIRWAAKDFAVKELATMEASVDKSFRDIVKIMGGLGFFGIKLPLESQEDTDTWVMLGILTEEIAKVNIELAYYIMISHELCMSLACFGTKEAKDDWLPGLTKGEKIGCLCQTEPDAGTYSEAITTRAIMDGDHYLVSGRKEPVSFGQDADVALCFVETGGNGDKNKSALLMPLDVPGVDREPIRQMGIQLSNPTSLKFKNSKIPIYNLLGGEGEGLQISAKTGLLSSINKILSGLISIGIAQTALNLAIQYSKKRNAFGKPISKFEGISLKLAEGATIIEAGRWLCYRALSLMDGGLPHAKEAAMAGWWCPRTSYQVIQDSLLVHGHAGYSDDHPFQQMLRDVVAFEMISGTEQILKLLISHETMGDIAVPDSVVKSMEYL